MALGARRHAEDKKGYGGTEVSQTQENSKDLKENHPEIHLQELSTKDHEKEGGMRIRKLEINLSKVVFGMKEKHDPNT